MTQLPMSNRNTDIETIVQTYKTMVHSIILTHIYHIPDADDVFQEVFWRMYNQTNHFTMKTIGKHG